MAANGISTLGTKALKQVAKLNIAQAKKQGRVVAAFTVVAQGHTVMADH